MTTIAHRPLPRFVRVPAARTAAVPTAPRHEWALLRWLRAERPAREVASATRGSYGAVHAERDIRSLGATFIR